MVCLSPALAGSLGGGDEAHVVGNMEGEGLISREIGYYAVFPSQWPAIFWLSLQKIVEATSTMGPDRNQEKSMR